MDIRTMGNNKRKIARHYNGNPLAYFRAHKDLYEGMNRRQLSKFDCGLYRALGRAGQLEAAFPETNEFFIRLGRRVPGEGALSKMEIYNIVRSYGSCEGFAYRAAKKFNHSPTTILKCWRKAGLKIRKREQKFSDAKIGRMTTLYRMYKKTAKVAKYLNCAPSTVVRYCRANGLEIRKRGRPKKN